MGGVRGVSPLRGEWIEIAKLPREILLVVVSPLRGEWIEIAMVRWMNPRSSSLASQRRVD